MTPTSRSRHALFVLWLGFAALVLHALAGIAHPRPAADPEVIEVCTATGIVRLDARTMQPLAAAEPEAQPAPSCCELCGASCAPAVPAVQTPLLGTTATGPELPATHQHHGRADEALTPLVPRGPPGRS